MKTTLARVIAKWTEDRSNGDAPNLSRSIRLDCWPSARRAGRYAAVGIRQALRSEYGFGRYVVIASMRSGATPEQAIRRMIRAYWRGLKEKR